MPWKGSRRSPGGQTNHDNRGNGLQPRRRDRIEKPDVSEDGRNDRNGEWHRECVHPRRAELSRARHRPSAFATRRSSDAAG
jgi:hypothetical protein